MSVQLGLVLLTDACERKSEVDQTEGNKTMFGFCWWMVVWDLMGCGGWSVAEPSGVAFPSKSRCWFYFFFISFAIFKRKETVGLWFCNLWLKRCWCVTWSFVIYGIISFCFRQAIHNNDNNGLISILNNYFAVLDADSIKSIPDINILLKRLSPKKLSCSVKIITKKSIYWLCCQSYHGAASS